MLFRIISILNLESQSFWIFVDFCSIIVYSLESILIYLLFIICVYLSNSVSLKNGKKKNIYDQGWPVSPVYLCCSICSVLKRIEKEKKKLRARADPLAREPVQGRARALFFEPIFKPGFSARPLKARCPFGPGRPF